MLNLVVDQGNTQTKFGLFQDGELVFHKAVKDFDGLKALLDEFSPEKAIVSTVKDLLEEPLALLNARDVKTHVFSVNTPLPFQLEYKTPETLGLDRIAACAGSQHFYPEKSALVVDMGTCITADFFKDGSVFQGGWIMPGIQMRLRSMHEGTAKLPSLEADADKVPEFLGKSTRTSMLSGVIHAIRFEVLGFWEEMKKVDPWVHLVITGGDHVFFDTVLKDRIFVRPNLNLYGLNRILNFNVEVI